MTRKSIFFYFVVSALCMVIAGSVGYGQGFLSGLDVPKHVRELHAQLDEFRAETLAAKEDLQHAMEKVDKVLTVIDTALDVVKKVEHALK